MSSPFRALTLGLSGSRGAVARLEADDAATRRRVSLHGNSFRVVGLSVRETNVRRVRRGANGPSLSKRT